MDVAVLRRELERFDPAVPIEEAWTPPASWYTSPEVWELERRTLFSRSWQPLCRVDELREPGDHVAGCFAGEPWVVVRDGEGELRAFQNACRHKGREVVVGAGNAGELVCGYHGWTYRLDGRLKSAPETAGIRGFDREAMSLVPLRCEVWGPWVFVSGDPQARPQAERAPELTRLLDESGWGELRFHSRTAWEIGCNWKVYVDNYLDGGYHIAHMHPTLDAQIDMATYRTRCFEESSVQTVDPRAEADDRVAFDARERIGRGAVYAWIHPNLMLNRYGPCLDSNWVVPLGPDRCRVVYDFFFREAEGDGARLFVEESIEQSGVTQREDIAICESVQVGLASSGYDRGRYAPRVEVGEHQFHGLVRRDLLSGLEAL